MARPQSAVKDLVLDPFCDAQRQLARPGHGTTYARPSRRNAFSRITS
jgi:hypothetical protein